MPKSGANVSIPTKLLATAVALAVTLVVCGTAATVLVSTDIARKDEQAALEPNVVLLERESFRDRGATALLIDSLLTPLGALGQATEADVALVTAVFAGPRPPNATLSPDVQRATKYSPGFASLVAPGTDMRRGAASEKNTSDAADLQAPAAPAGRNDSDAHRDAWFAAADSLFPAPRPEASSRAFPVSFGLDSLSNAELDAAVADTSSPWLPVFRRWARSKPLPALWSYRMRTAFVRTVDEMPARNYSSMRTLFAMNEHVAFLEMKSGHADDAMNRARENLSASRHFIEQPLLFDALVGRILVRRAAQLLAMTALRAGDTAQARAATRLDSLASHSEGRTVLQWLLQEESSPRSAAAEQVSANRALHPGLRVGAMNTIVMGGCRNVREVLFGFSAARRDALQRSVNSLADVSRGAELGALYLNKFDAVVGDPEAATPRVQSSRPSRLSALGPAQWIVPPGVRARVTWCSASGY